jgi:hypothetical protein
MTTSDDLNGKTTGELVVMMRDTIQKLVDAEGISTRDAIALLTEAIVLGGIVIGSVKGEPTSIAIGSIAGRALEAEILADAERLAKIAESN